MRSRNHHLNETGKNWVVAMNLRTYFLLLAVASVAWAPAAHAKCPKMFSDAGISIMGTVIEHMKSAGMLKIETKGCGKITVGIPAQTRTELGVYYDECKVGSLAAIEGDMIMSILEAKKLSCLL